MKVSLLACPRPCRSGSVTLRQFWFTFTLSPRRVAHVPDRDGTKVLGSAFTPPAEAKPAGGVSGAPSTPPPPESGSPPPGIEFGGMLSLPRFAISSPEINRRWILFRCLTLNGAAPASGPVTAGATPATSTPVARASRRVRRAFGMRPSPLRDALSGRQCADRWMERTSARRCGQEVLSATPAGAERGRPLALAPGLFEEELTHLRRRLELIAQRNRVVDHGAQRVGTAHPAGQEDPGGPGGKRVGDRPDDRVDRVGPGHRAAH